MKNTKKGITLVEIIVAMNLFLLAVVPTIRINVNILKANRVYGQLEEEQKLFENIVNTIKLRKYNDLRKFVGIHNYIFQEGEGNKIELFPRDNLIKEISSAKCENMGKKIVIRVLEIDNIKGILLIIEMESDKKIYQEKRLIFDL